MDRVERDSPEMEPRITTQEEMVRENPDSREANDSTYLHPSPDSRTGEAYETWEPKPPKILMEDLNASPLEILEQIQLYATNE